MPLYFSSFMVPAGAGVPFLIEDKHLKGGFRIVSDIPARDAIPMAARKQGMRVYVTSEEKTYTIGLGGLSAWEVVPTVKVQSSPLDITPDAVLAPGSFGVGGPSVTITDSLDNYTSFNCTVQGEDLIGAPVEGSVIVSVFVGEDYCVQTAYAVSTKESFVRYFDSEIFSQWSLDFNSNNQFGLGPNKESALSALSLNQVDNTSDGDKPISRATQAAFDLVTTALAAKVNSESYIEDQIGLNNVLDNKVDLDAFNSAIAASAYGIKYTWTNEAARIAQTGMLEFEQGVQQDNRIVYSYNGTSWVPFYELDAVHNHDSAYLKLSGGALTGDLELVGANLKKTTASGTARWLAQDGTGRQHWYWNTEGGVTPTFERGGESALDLYLHTDLNSSQQLVFRAANGDSANAGDPLVWQDILVARSDGTFEYKGNTVHHNGNTLNIGASRSSALSTLNLSGFGEYVDLRGTAWGQGATLPNQFYGAGVKIGFANGGPSGLAITGLPENAYGIVTIYGQYIDASGIASISRTFLRNGVMYVQYPASATAWAPWQTIGGNITTVSAPNTVAQRDSASAIYASDFIIGSDRKLKENDITIENALTIVNQWEGKLYNLIGNARTNSGFIAQELEKITPHLIYEVNDTKHVAYMQCVPYLVEAIKELTQKLERLQNAAGIRTY